MKSPLRQSGNKTPPCSSNALISECSCRSNQSLKSSSGRESPELLSLYSVPKRIITHKENECHSSHGRQRRGQTDPGRDDQQAVRLKDPERRHEASQEPSPLHGHENCPGYLSLFPRERGEQRRAASTRGAHGHQL